MKVETIAGYFFLGTAIRYLQDVREGTTIHDNNYILDNIDALIKSLEKISMPVSQSALTKTGYLELRERLASTPKDSKLSSGDAEELRRKTKELRIVVSSELETKTVYVLEDRRYDTNKLSNSVEKLFPEGTFDKLSDLTQHDLREACKAIVYNLPTSAAFMLLRATESVLKDYFCKKIKRNRPKVLTMGSMIHALDASKKAKDTNLIVCLKNIKDSYRNPTGHPEKIYGLDEVQNLFGLCVDAIAKMTD